MYHVYAIKSINHNYIYVGLTKDINNRMDCHNAGREKTTRFYAPFKIIYNELVETRILARKRERYLKSGSGKEFLRELIIT